MIDWPEMLSPVQRQAFWILLIAIMSNASCAILGSFLVLRRMSLLGDSLSHAVLPGLAIAFFITSRLDPIVMLLGASICGMLMAGFSVLIQRYGQTSEEASLGFVYTAFFALGIFLIQYFAENVHLDRDVVLEGAIEFVTLDLVSPFGTAFPRAFLSLLIVLSIILALTFVFWRSIKATCFDPQYASMIGLKGKTILGLGVCLLAACIVVSFQVVGSILVVAMLVVPAATAQLHCHRLHSLMLSAVGWSVLSSVGGYWLAYQWDTSIAGMMSVIAGVCYAAVLLMHPQQGYLLQLSRHRQHRHRIRQEDVLTTIYRLQEHGESDSGWIPLNQLQQFANQDWLSQTLNQLVLKNWIERNSADEVQLTETGHKHAITLVRGHRLWEAFLNQQFALPADHLHEAAHSMEHYLSPQAVQALGQQLNSPALDPHGKSIPDEPGANSTET